MIRIYQLKIKSLKTFMYGLFLFPFVCTAEDMITCAEGMIEGGTYYKATSLGGISISNPKVVWLGNGDYSISMNVISTQGMKRWYSSTSRFDWIESSRTGPLLGKHMNDCSSGLVVAAQQSNPVKIGYYGRGIANLTAGSMGGQKGESFVLYDERLDGFIQMSNITVDPNYATGNSKEDNGITRHVNFTATFSNFFDVPDGNYTVNVVIPIGATTTWWPVNNGYNYWWAVSGRGIPLSYSITVPVNIRSEDQKPVNPVSYCTVPSSLTIDHGTLSPGAVSNNVKSGSISISCNGSMTGSFEITADNDSSIFFTKAFMGRGVTSNISASIDGMNWYRKLTSFPLHNGKNTLQVQSVLSTSGTPTAGSIAGSAIIIIKYN